MNKEEVERFPPENARIIRRNWRVLLRVFFASVWTIDAYFKWLFELYGGSLTSMISSASQGQPQFVASWITFWASASSSVPAFTFFIAISETVIAILLFVGLLVPVVSVIGVVFNLLIWSTAEGFGGIFQSGATDVGTGPLYAAIFAGLIVIQAGRQKGIDKTLHRKFPRIPLW